MAILEDIRCELDRLEASNRRHGIITVRQLAEALPRDVARYLSLRELHETAQRLNALREVESAPEVDAKSRAAGE